METELTAHPILLFDGVCNLCNASVNFVIRRDPAKRFRFASLQSPAGQELLKKFGLETEKFDTVVLVEGNRHYARSDAALEVARRMRGFWKLLYVFKIIPRLIRDPLYNWVARNRYRWFGKKDQCMLPAPELKERFL